jgi:hypothetical protein
MIHLRTTDLHWRIVDGDLLVLDTRTQRYLVLNHSAAVLWQLLADGTTRSRLQDQLVSEYDISPTRAAEDVNALINELSQHTLLDERAEK